ncbi:MAG: hypothetical protein ACK47M_11520, partial [Caldilinea sp.]
MARKLRGAAQSNADLSLTEFTRTFFTTFGATVRQDSSQVKQAFDVELTEPLRQHFGRERLRLIFHTGEVEPGVELVAHGSRVFDQMMALLD